MVNPVSYINEGTYGCVFQPHIPCSGVPSSADGGTSAPTVGKLMFSEEDVQEELLNVKEVRLLDPEALFTVKMLGTCKGEELGSPALPDGEAAKCKVPEMRDVPEADRIQIVYQHGGETFTRYVTSPMSEEGFMYLFDRFDNLFYGAMALDEFGKVHLDIKSENVLFDGETLRLIDFGLATKQEHMRSNPITKQPYMFFPPEMRVYWKTLRDGRLDDSDLQNILGTYANAGGPFRSLQGIFSPEEDLRAVAALAASRGGIGALTAYASRRADVFALGWLVCFMYAAADDLRGSHDAVRLAVSEFVKSTARFDPRKRCTPDEACDLHHRTRMFVKFVKSGPERPIPLRDPSARLLQKAWPGPASSSATLREVLSAAPPRPVVLQMIVQLGKLMESDTWPILSWGADDLRVEFDQHRSARSVAAVRSGFRSSSPPDPESLRRAFPGVYGDGGVVPRLALFDVEEDVARAKMLSEANARVFLEDKRGVLEMGMVVGALLGALPGGGTDGEKPHVGFAMDALARGMLRINPEQRFGVDLAREAHAKVAWLLAHA